jgi:hypothetical protein
MSEEKDTALFHTRIDKKKVSIKVEGGPDWKRLLAIE